MKSKDFLRSKGILSNDSDHYIIDFHDGREINLGDLLEEYAQQSQPSPAGAAEHYIYDKEKDDFVRDEDGERVCLSSQKEVYDYLKAEGLKEDWIATNFVSLLPFAPSDFLKCKKLNYEIKS